MKHRILHEIQSVQFANPINLFSYLADTSKGSVRQVNIKIEEYLKSGYINPIPFDGKPINENYKSWGQFYYLTKTGSQVIDRVNEYRQKVSKSSNSLEHESMKIDVALSFIRNYPEYEFSFNYKADFKGIRPDILVNAKNIYNNKHYTFFVEIERSKKEMTYIYKEKILNYNKFINNGLFENKGFFKPKVLFVCAYNQYPFYLRPQQYNDKIYQSYFIDVYRLFDTFLKLLKNNNTSDKYYRFIPFPEFTKIAEPIWRMPSGTKVRIIE